MKQYTNLRVVVKDEKTNNTMKVIVNQLVEGSYVEKLIKQFVEFAETRGYYVDTTWDIKDCVIMLSKNNNYYLVVESYINLGVNNQNIDMDMSYLDDGIYGGM